MCNYVVVIRRKSFSFLERFSTESGSGFGLKGLLGYSGLLPHIGVGLAGGCGARVRGWE